MDFTKLPIAERIQHLLQATRHFEGVDRSLLDKYGLPRKHATSTRAKRKGVSKRTQFDVFRRDHFIDRYTGEKLIFPGALLLLGMLYPEAFPRARPDEGWRVGECHHVYWTLMPTVDHIHPVARGEHPDYDLNDTRNLVTASMVTNTARSVWMEHEVPARLWLPVTVTEEQARATEWDGMLSWFIATIRENPTILGRDRSVDTWYRDAERHVMGKLLKLGEAAPRAKLYFDGLTASGGSALLKKQIDKCLEDLEG